MRRSLSVSLLLLAASIQAQQSPVTTENFLVTDKDVYFVGPPNSLLGTMVATAKWSPTGRHLLAQQGSLPRSAEALRDLLFPTAPVKVSISVRVMDAHTGEERSVYQYSSGDQFVSNMAWSPDGAMAFLVVNSASAGGRNVQILRVQAESGETSPFAPWGNKKLWRADFHESPDGRATILVAQFSSEMSDIDSTHAYTVSSQGLQEIQIPKSDVGIPELVWQSDGQPVMRTWVHALQEGTVRQVWSLLSRRGEAPVEVSEPKVSSVEPQIFAHLAQDSVGTDEQEDTRSIQAGWLKAQSAEKEVLVAANASWVALSPSVEHVAYIAEGALFVRPILRMDLAVYQKLQSEEARALAMNNAKQVGIAAMIFATDNEDRIPSARDFMDLLAPYLKDPEAMKNFVWTHPGGDISQMDNPAAVELGYIALPGGRCVLYGDGHIKWMPEK